jgi:hypothetical protein
LRVIAPLTYLNYRAVPVPLVLVLPPAPVLLGCEPLPVPVLLGVGAVAGGGGVVGAGFAPPCTIGGGTVVGVLGFGVAFGLELFG